MQADQSRFDIGEIGVLPDVHPHIPGLVPGDPADKAGLKPNDLITAIDGKPITFSSQLREAIAKRRSRSLRVVDSAEGMQQTIDVMSARHGDIGWIGVAILDAFKTFKPGAVRSRPHERR